MVIVGPFRPCAKALTVRGVDASISSLSAAQQPHSIMLCVSVCPVVSASFAHSPPPHDTRAIAPDDIKRLMKANGVETMSVFMSNDVQAVILRRLGPRFPKSPFRHARLLTSYAATTA
jgi:hypothetical protein